ncbi:hypothetical protein TNCV_359161 [Trichonephila clavipes]|nr:hypothetical protein TNCV_359161 [Trichonephila clavipes]
MSRTDENMISTYEKENFTIHFWRNSGKRNVAKMIKFRTLSDIVNFIKIQQVKWAGHVVRMDEVHTTKKSLQCPTNWIRGHKRSPKLPTNQRGPSFSPSVIMMRAQTEFSKVGERIDYHNFPPARINSDAPQKRRKQGANVTIGGPDQHDDL